MVALGRGGTDAERGETILFPLLNVLIDQMSPPHLKGLLRRRCAGRAGWCPRCLAGGWILAVWGGQALYVLMAVLCLFTFLLYEWGARIARPARIRVRQD